MMEYGQIVTLAGMGLGAVIWAIRVEGRVSVIDSKYEDMVDRLERIERLIDRRMTQVMDYLHKK